MASGWVLNIPDEVTKKYISNGDDPHSLKSFTRLQMHLMIKECQKHHWARPVSFLFGLWCTNPKFPNHRSTKDMISGNEYRKS